MRRDDFLQAFHALGTRLPEPAHIVVAGGSALILAGYVDRDTGDGDLIEWSPKLSALERYVGEVADELGLPRHWLNDGVRAWRDLLPPDLHTRLEHVGSFGNLAVGRVGRQDLILMKLAAGRPRDLEDVATLAPTSAEIAFVQSQLERIAAFDSSRAMRIELYLHQSPVSSPARGAPVVPPRLPGRKPKGRRRL